MSKHALLFTTIAAATFFSPASHAQPLQPEPQYLGDRSNNPEQETYAAVLTEVGGFVLAFIGPARNVGSVTGDQEKDTVAFVPFLAVPRDERWSFRSDE
jgi:hypothetical protein